jgi:hypothetical protein
VFVEVVAVHGVPVTVVDVVAVQHCDVATALAVNVVVTGVLDVSRHLAVLASWKSSCMSWHSRRPPFVVTPTSRTPIETLGDAHECTKN